MHNRLRLASLLAGLAIVVGACGGGSLGATPTTPAATQPASSGDESAVPSAAAFPEGDFALTLWTKEGEGDGSYQFVKKMADAYTAAHPTVTFEVVNKDVELLRTDFQTASLAGDAPDLLWTVSDHYGPFHSADLIQPVGSLIDPAAYVPSALDVLDIEDQVWGVPISYGNQLMLYWNKDLAGDTAPADSDAWVAKAKELTSGDTVGIAFNQGESFWLVPFLGGFGGSVFADDDKTPTLNTDAMKSALQFMYDLKFTDKVTPGEADYNVADGLFKEGKAAYIINGDWTLAAYAAAADAETPGLGDKLGVGPLPTMTGGEDPKPYVAGTYFMVPKAVAGDELTIVADFMTFVTNTENQVDMVNTLKRLPGNAEAFADDVVTGDPLLSSAAEAAAKGVGQPVQNEMRCVFDAMTPGVKDLLAGNSDVAAIAAAMQTSAETCIASLT
jgi:arabinogalactan oligomer/maltooligosaccharide transport system substrate-binding protein